MTTEARRPYRNVPCWKRKGDAWRPKPGQEGLAPCDQWGRPWRGEPTTVWEGVGITIPNVKGGLVEALLRCPDGIYPQGLLSFALEMAARDGTIDTEQQAAEDLIEELVGAGAMRRRVLGDDETVVVDQRMKAALARMAEAAQETPLEPAVAPEPEEPPIGVVLPLRPSRSRLEGRQAAGR